MTLQEVTERMGEMIVEMETVGSDLAVMQYELENRKAELLLGAVTDQYRNQEMREAAVRDYVEKENLLRPVLEKRSQFAKLNNEKDLLIEISRNLRLIEGAK
jgi:hypothetical protein